MPPLVPLMALLALATGLGALTLRRSLGRWAHRRQSAADDAEEAAIERYELLWRGFTFRWLEARRVLDRLLLACTALVATVAAASVYLVVAAPGPVDVTLFEGSPISIVPAGWGGPKPTHPASAASPSGSAVASRAGRRHPTPGPGHPPVAIAATPGLARPPSPGTLNAFRASPSPAASPSPRPTPTPTPSPRPTPSPSPSPSPTPTPTVRPTP